MKKSIYHLPYNPTLIDRARELRRDMTLPEKKLWGFLRTLPVRVLRQRPIGSFIVDFYCPSHKVVFEVDGAQHTTAEGVAHDEARSAVLAGFGLSVVRFGNREVMHDFAAVQARVLAGLNLEPSSSHVELKANG